MIHFHQKNDIRFNGSIHHRPSPAQVGQDVVFEVEPNGAGHPQAWPIGRMGRLGESDP